MLHSIFKNGTIKTFLPALLCSTIFSFAAKAGGDTYAVYLNNKLIFKQAGLETSVNNLQLSKANYNDELVIYYSHCGQTGTGRSIVLKDDKNNILKEWKFADASGSDVSMKIPVKEILELQKKNANASLSLVYFSSKYLPKGRLLTSIKWQDKN